MERKISVSILSRNRLLRESIARILTNKREFDVIPSASRNSSLGENRPSGAVDVWVSDSLKCLIEDAPSSREANNGNGGWVLVAMEEDAKQFLTAVSHGVLGYVLQEASAVDVVAAIRGVARGEAVCPARLARVLFDYVSSHKDDLHISRARRQFRLTRREQQLVPLVGRGLTNKEIATALSVSEQTIKSHIHRILQKVGVGDRFAITAACQSDQIGS